MPLVYNCGGYERVETLRSLEGLVDIWLPDLKYADGALASQLSAAPDYFPVATAAIQEMFRQTGPYVMENGLLRRGVVIRHLVLPGYLDNTRRVIDWVAETFRPGDVLFSLMSQYTPSPAHKDVWPAASPAPSTAPPQTICATAASPTALPKSARRPGRSIRQL